MTNQEIAVREGVLPESREPSVQNITALAQHFIASGYFKDATDVSKAVVKILAGREIGIGPFTAMTGINVIEGSIALSANLIAAQIKRHGRYNFTIKEHTNERCVLEFFEDGKSVGESSFSMEDAKKIVRHGKPLIGGDNWRNYPRNMLFARAVSNGARWYCPDVFGGTPVYTPEELDAPATKADLNDQATLAQQTPPEAQEGPSGQARHVGKDITPQEWQSLYDWASEKYGIEWPNGVSMILGKPAAEWTGTLKDAAELIRTTKTQAAGMK